MTGVQTCALPIFSSRQLREQDGEADRTRARYGTGPCSPTSRIPGLSYLSHHHILPPIHVLYEQLKNSSIYRRGHSHGRAVQFIGWTAYDRVSDTAHGLVAEQYALLNGQILPALAAEGIRFFRRSPLTTTARRGSSARRSGI